VYPSLRGKKCPVLVAVDLGDGRPVAIAQVDENNPQAVKRWLEPLVRELGVQVIVSDDLSSLRSVAKALGVEQQVCQFHVRRWVQRSLRHLRQTIPKEWLWVLEEVEELLNELPADGAWRLHELWAGIPERRVGQGGALSPLSRLRMLLLRLSQHWSGALDKQSHRASYRADADAQPHGTGIQILARSAGGLPTERRGSELVGEALVGRFVSALISRIHPLCMLQTPSAP
jgi:hypothetical protein